jgi:hypothetical protein
LWLTVSNAFDKSRKIPTAISFRSIAAEILSYKSIKANEVEWFSENRINYQLTHYICPNNPINDYNVPRKRVQCTL